MMYRLTVVVAAVSFAGCASMHERQALRIDGTNRATFEASVASFQQALPTVRRQLFDIALRDIWWTTAAEAGPEPNEADTVKIYFARLDGLKYREIIDLADGTPPTTRQQHAALYPARSPAIPAPMMRTTLSNPGPSMGTSYNRMYNVYPSGHVPVE